MKNLYLIRHGESTLNQSKVYYGATDCPLTAKGRKQSRALATHFRQIDLDLLYVSPLKRAMETAHIGFDAQIPCREDERLQEMNFGLWEGKNYGDLANEPLYQTWQADWENTKTPQGESFNDLACRVEAFGKELLATTATNVAVVSHNGVIMLLLAYVCGFTRKQSWHFALEPGRYTHIAFADDFPVLKALNR